MSAKFIHTLSDENPNLQKQIGCMNGIFQLFDRHHFLGGGRRITGQNQKRLPAGQNGNNSIEPKSTSQKTTEKDHKKAIKEKLRVPTESSRTSFSSSSCSSSLSSLECNRASPLEPCLLNQTVVPETHAQDLPSPIHQPNTSFQSSQQSPDLRDAVKDSINREARGLSVKTATKGESGGQTLKYFDSPRPLQQPKSAKNKVTGLKESFQVVHKLQEAPRKSSEGKHVSLTSGLKDARRLSCDGRESRDINKSTIKLKELPRLSLDSRAGSMRGPSTEMKSNDPLRDLERGNRNFNNFLNQQEPESHTRLSNVVAKLMGLEAFPGSMSTNENQRRQIKTHPHVEKNPFLASSRNTDESKQNRIPGSRRNVHKEPISPWLRNVDSVKKPITNSKFPIEPAPRRQPDGSRGSETLDLKSRIPPKAQNTSLSVYGEIEKNLAQLEFKRSGKDLRALKQILEAIQKTKERLETRNESIKLGTQPSSNNILHQNSQLSNLDNLQSASPISTPTRRTSSPKSSKSPIVIIKPTKLIKATNPASSVNPTSSFSVLHRIQTADSADGRKESFYKQNAKDPTPRANHVGDRSSLPTCPMDKNTVARLTRLSQTSKEPQSAIRESNNSGKSLGALNLRQQRKKIGLEKQTRPTTQLSDPIKTQKQSSRQITESTSSCRKSKPKSANLQPSDDELSDSSSVVRDMSHQGDTISQQSESTISLASQVDEEVTSTNKSNKINNNFIQPAHQRQKKTVARSMKDRSIAEPAVVSSAQPSPVSVLDATFYNDDLPSPIKKKPVAFKEDEIEWNPTDLNHSSSSTNDILHSVINHKKSDNIHLLIHDLTLMLSAQEVPFIDEITPHYNRTNPDHQYILEILLSSGLLKDFESGFTIIHLHETGYPVDPDLFLALEKAKAGTTNSNDKERGANASQSEHHIKIQRKLVFDVVNEILAHKLRLESCSKYWHSPNMLADRRPRGQKLLGELCSEVDRLQGNASHCSLQDENDCVGNILRADLKHQSMHWTTYSSELPWLVLDVERLIFKDLLSEVVTGEALGLQVQSAGCCRQLFSK
ncbi:hypothetical protein P3X46_016337 [Hevea brasiliensis]|uniref:DUF4378 domain-containing protein n=1 Tax=Hevea brasiliensis TaxID=3981 RepID=A0ABQ9LYS5_HEVBR|nr:protein LONGIFOLIA 1 [Hevea brasiliensis]KAJ9173174.1 hypothetical protein P3X46_016337 [Hevea brasiliensis]